MSVNKKHTTVPASTPRNPTVVPMLKLTKPGRHKIKKKEPVDSRYFDH